MARIFFPEQGGIWSCVTELTVPTSALQLDSHLLRRNGRQTSPVPEMVQMNINRMFVNCCGFSLFNMLN